MPLEKGSTIQLGLCVDDDDLTRPGRVALTPTTEQTALVQGVQPGMTLLFDDGLMEVKMLERISDTDVTCQVVEGGNLKSRNLKRVEMTAALASGSTTRPPLSQPWARVLPLFLGSGPSPFEATRQPSKGRPETEDLRPNPLTGTAAGPPSRAS